VSLKCPEHDVEAVLVDDAVIYHGHSFGRVWMCPHQGCTRRVGAHKDSGAPKGSLATESMRRARIKAHAAFDGWWKREGIKRSQAYKKLSEVMGSKRHAHIGHMDEAECQRVIQEFGSKS